MDSKSSTKANVFLFLNLLCYVLAPATACDTCSGQQPSTCPRDTLKLGVCAKLLGGLVDVKVGNPSTTPCCSVVAGLMDLDAAICLCIAIKANVMGINTNIPVAFSLLLNACRITELAGFVCA
ncbi:lipid transfer protein earli 1 [Phtheirospermum japonicum]|uniref:Lipid transfer protein earli 1 n=1 Tax=Phtheirospermum japonicum TaxID=374723 RepID=A0A830BLB2_9LAMI|nr:lipid transfer protein earli 1 [Phtheirospermum japonicum]